MIPIVYAHLPVSPSQLFLSCLAPPNLLRSSVPFFLSCSSHPRSQCAHLCLLRAFYLRLVGKAKDVYMALEPLYNDFRKLRFKDADAKYVIRHMDEFIGEMLSTDFLLNVTMPFLQRREVSLSLHRFPVRACPPPQPHIVAAMSLAAPLAAQ